MQNWWPVKVGQFFMGHPGTKNINSMKNEDCVYFPILTAWHWVIMACNKKGPP